MGLTSYALGRVRRPLAQGFKAGKLLFNCVQTGPRPLKIGEKVGVFLLGQASGKAALLYYLVRAAGGKWHAGRREDQALAVLVSYCGSDVEDGVVQLGEVEHALHASQQQCRDKKTLDARAGFLFVHVLMEKQAVDSRIARRYKTQDGLFDAAACMKDFFGSSKAYTLIQQLRKHPEILPEEKKVLVPTVVKIWEDYCVHLRNEAIDFLLL